MNRQSSTAVTICLILVQFVVFACNKRQVVHNGAGFVGVYILISVNDERVPASISHDGVTLEVRSGTFTINADGTCSSRTVFVPPTGTEVVREVDAKYTKDDSKLTMQWEGAGSTVGTIQGNTFTMVNEGMVFVYRK